MNERTKKRVAGVFKEIAEAIETGEFGHPSRIGLTLSGSEHGIREVLKGAELAAEKFKGIEVVLIGEGIETDLELVEGKDLDDAHKIMEEMLENGDLDGAVTLHYNFPLGISTVGRVKTPARGKEMLMATTTGSSAVDRVTAMMRNTIYGIAVAKSLGHTEPDIGILNIEGARVVEKGLRKLKDNGYDIHFAESTRSDGGAVMRGNDLLQGTPDIMVTDTLTGNILMKMFSSFTTGGGYEATGYGYGPGVGEDYNKLIAIISRASGAPVIANSIQFVAQASQGQLNQILNKELDLARRAGLDEILTGRKSEQPADKKEQLKAPPAVTVEEEIAGIDILSIEEAKNSLWQDGIYAETGMGCTGPVVLVAEEDRERACKILKKQDFIN